MFICKLVGFFRLHSYISLPVNICGQGFPYHYPCPYWSPITTRITVPWSCVKWLEMAFNCHRKCMIIQKFILHIRGHMPLPPARKGLSCSYLAKVLSNEMSHFIMVGKHALHIQPGLTKIHFTEIANIKLNQSKI